MSNNNFDIINGRKYKKCKDNQIRNPKTNRCIKIINKKICPDGKVLNPKTNRCIKIINKKILNHNNNLFKKLFNPFINRISANIYDRIKYYYLLIKVLNIDENKNYCMRLYKYNNDGKPIYRIGNNIILKKQIGLDSSNGLIYLSSFRDKYNKIFKYAIKCIVSNNQNKKEIKLLEIVNNAVLNNKCPHFPIIYSVIKCNDFLNFDSSYIKSENNSERITKNEIDDIKNYPYIFQKNKKKSFYFILNELANGDLKTFLETYHNDYYLLLNAFVQIYLSLMFFYQETKYFHYDSHWGNFLYHKIKPGGYFHYNIFGNDYYIENFGFLWIIWDYGVSTDFKKSIKELIFVDNDFKQIINAFFNNNIKINDYDTIYINDNDINNKDYNKKGWLLAKYLLNSDFKTIMGKINKELFIDTIKELKFVQINKYNSNYISRYTRKYNFYSQLPDKEYKTPQEYYKYLLYSKTNMNNIISFILNIFVKHKIIKTNIKPKSKIINNKPYIINKDI